MLESIENAPPTKNKSLLQDPALHSNTSSMHSRLHAFSVIPFRRRQELILEIGATYQAYYALSGLRTCLSALNFEKSYSASEA